MKFPDLKNQKSVSRTYKEGEEISDDGLLWFQDAIGQLSEEVFYGKTPYESVRKVNQKFKITITKL